MPSRLDPYGPEGDSEETGHLGPKLVVHGHLSGSGTIRIDASMEGDIAVDGQVELGDTADVQAAVQVSSLVVSGQLRGTVKATGAVRIRNGGCVYGDVIAPRVAIDDGGALQGGVDMDVDARGSDERASW